MTPQCLNNILLYIHKEETDSLDLNVHKLYSLLILMLICKNKTFRSSQNMLPQTIFSPRKWGMLYVTRFYLTYEIQPHQCKISSYAKDISYYTNPYGISK